MSRSFTDTVTTNAAAKAAASEPRKQWPHRGCRRVGAHDPLAAGWAGHWKLDGDLTDESPQGRTLSAEGPRPRRVRVRGLHGHVGRGGRLVVGADRCRHRRKLLGGGVDEGGRADPPGAAGSMGDPEYTPFSLGDRLDTERWGMVVTCPTSKGCEHGGGVAHNADRPKVGAWVHLTGVYDAQAGEARIYVNGRFAGKTTDVHSWNKSGELLIGRTVWTGTQADPWYGAIDEVRVFAGVPTDKQIGQLAVR